MPTATEKNRRNWNAALEWLRGLETALHNICTEWGANATAASVSSRGGSTEPRQSEPHSGPRVGYPIRSVTTSRRRLILNRSTISQLRDDIDAGRTGDKIDWPDPAAVPLGT